MKRIASKVSPQNESHRANETQREQDILTKRGSLPPLQNGVHPSFSHKTPPT